MLPEKALLDLWNAVRPGIPFAQEMAICRFWSQDPYRYGSPLGPERDRDDGQKVQMFALMPLRWTGEEVVEGA